MLLGVFQKIIKDAKYTPMSKVAPIVRRPVNVVEDGQYLELGIRSFGKGTFCKPALMALRWVLSEYFTLTPVICYSVMCLLGKEQLQ